MYIHEVRGVRLFRGEPAQGEGAACQVEHTGPVSYTHLDVYKRQRGDIVGAAECRERDSRHAKQG